MFNMSQSHSTTKILHSMIYGKGEGIRALSEETTVIWSAICIALSYYYSPNYQHSGCVSIGGVEAFLNARRDLLQLVDAQFDHFLMKKQFRSLLSMCFVTSCNKISDRLVVLVAHLCQLNEDLPTRIPFHSRVVPVLETHFSRLLDVIGSMLIGYPHVVWPSSVLVFVNIKYWALLNNIGAIANTYEDELTGRWLSAFPAVKVGCGETRCSIHWAQASAVGGGFGGWDNNQSRFCGN